ncbi:MAG TPA: hypothetical protein VFR35_01560 [Actinoplanes sp.]|nr:hypothetical protein [Actinoplanes sp.]
MPTLVQRLQMFLRSPHGQRMIREGQRQLARPENQAKLRRLLARLRGQRRP